MKALSAAALLTGVILGAAGTWLLTDDSSRVDDRRLEMAMKFCESQAGGGVLDGGALTYDFERPGASEQADESGLGPAILDTSASCYASAASGWIYNDYDWRNQGDHYTAEHRGVNLRLTNDGDAYTLEITID